MFTDKELICLPGITVGIPVSHNVAACVMHLLRNQVSDIKISLEDLRTEGATLVLSAHFKPYPNEDMETEEEKEKMKCLREFWDSFMEEQKERLGLNNPLTREQIQQELALIEDGIIAYADPQHWSEEKKAYCKEIEDAIFADKVFANGLFDSVTDDWEEEEEYD